VWYTQSIAPIGLHDKFYLSLSPETPVDDVEEDDEEMEEDTDGDGFGD